MLNKLSLSIIIPVYNTEKYLKACIDSILKQNINNYEIILIDDGSIDSSKTILNDYACKHEQIRVHYNNHSGVSKARNTGILSASGEYIMFLDSDDTLTDNSLLHILSLTDDKTDIIIGSKNIVKSNEIIKKELPDRIYSDTNQLTNIINYIDSSDDINWYPWGKLFKRDIIIKNNILFDETLVSCEDFKFFYSYLLYSNGIKTISFPIVNYQFLREGALTVKINYEHIKSNILSFTSTINQYSSIYDKNELKHFYKFTYKYLFHESLFIPELSKEQQNDLISILKENKKEFKKYLQGLQKLRYTLYQIVSWNKGIKLYYKIWKLFHSQEVIIRTNNNL